MIVVLGIRSEQASAAEKLLDFIYFIQNKKKASAIVLVNGSDIHEEYRTKLKLAAEVAFEHVEMILGDPEHLFNAAVEFSDKLRAPWVYLEPDSVPLKHNWLTQLDLAYESQHKKVMGPFLKSPDRVWLAKQAVYAPDLARFTGDLTPLASRNRLIQIGKYTGRMDVRDKAPDDPAVLFCGDSTGELMTAIRKETKK